MPALNTTFDAGGAGAMDGVMFSRAGCLAALDAIETEMEKALEQARRQHAARCLQALRALLAPFELSRHEVRICANSGSTCLSVHARPSCPAAGARHLSTLRADGIVLDVLQEIDEFLQDHEEWTRVLDGEVLNP
ncbi:hypothetical protein GCM10023165_45880 [Variovorax defluvii]|uniref:Uncharacterized protein n=1 Tax=Variovorax defluvii TaxID=913761 RepID=A0ABP8IA13_9BURK